MPEWLTSLRLRVRALTLRQRIERALEDEIAFHVAMREEQLRTAGASDPGRAARRRFGSATRIREDLRAAWRLAPGLGDLWRDARFAARMLGRAPGHVLLAVLCLVVGIVASSCVYAVVNALFYRPLPGISGRGQVVRVALGTERPDTVPGLASTREIEQLRHVPQLAASLGSEANLRVTTVVGGDTIGASAAFISGNYFRLLGTSAARGRLLTDDDDRPGAEPVVVISHAFWHGRLVDRPDAIGQPIVIGRREFTIVGIAEQRFGGIDLAELGSAAGNQLHFWLPYSVAADWPGAPDPDTPWHAMIARIEGGRTTASVTAAVTAAASGLFRGTPPLGVHAVSSPLNAGPGDVPSDVAIMLALFFFVPLTVLGIGCANVANLQLARATARAHEITVRLSLGASRASIIKLLTIESVVLAGMACLAGLAGTGAVLRALESFIPLALAIDWRVLLFISAVAVLVIALTGLAPAWLTARRSVHAGQRQAAHGGGLAHSRLRSVLVGLQVALSLVLLVVGALLARSLQVMYVGAPAVTHELLAAQLDLGPSTVNETGRASLLRDLMARLAADGRIGSVAAANAQIVRYQAFESGPLDGRARARFVTSRWFDTMDMTPLAGRLPVAADGIDAVVVNRRLAESLHAGGSGPHRALEARDLASVVGRSLRLQDMSVNTRQLVLIVGVVENTPTPPDMGDDAAVYLPMPVSPPATLSIVVRTAVPAVMLPEVRRVLAETAPQLLLTDLATGDALLARHVSPIRYLVLSVGGLGIVALVLAAAGLYAVMSYIVLLRQHEIAVHLAIGARPGDVVRMMLGQSVRLAIAGVIAGVALVLPLVRIVRFLFVGVSPLDPTAMAVPVAVLAITALVAGALPAHRAARIDPVRALRHE